MSQSRTAAVDRRDRLKSTRWRKPELKFLTERIIADSRNRRFVLEPIPLWTISVLLQPGGWLVFHACRRKGFRWFPCLKPLLCSFRRVSSPLHNWPMFELSQLSSPRGILKMTLSSGAWRERLVVSISLSFIWEGIAILRCWPKCFSVQYRERTVGDDDHWSGILLAFTGPSLRDSDGRSLES